MEAFMKQLWEDWLDTKIPMLGGRTPMEASKSAGGRQQLDELLAFYESASKGMPASGGFIGNPPAEWVRRRLGMDGRAPEPPPAKSPMEVYNEARGLKKTTRAASATQRLHERLKSIFVPRRCEVEGCGVTAEEGLNACSKCKCVFYCGRKHQAVDWPRHKVECNHLKKIGLTAIHYTTGDEATQKGFPLGCFPLRPKADPRHPQASCFVCGASPSEVELGLTECCGLVVCNNDHEYVRIITTEKNILQT
jgi:hypothetical protein